MNKEFLSDYKKLILDCGTFNKTANGFNYQYLELAPLLDKVLPLIEQNNFCLIQTVVRTSEKITRKTETPFIWDRKDGDKRILTIEGVDTKTIETPLYELKSTLYHDSGECVECFMPLYVDDIDPQALGSSETYCRRYSIFALLHIRTADDDGLAGSNKGKSNKKEFDSLPKLPEDINQIATFLMQQPNPKAYYREIKENQNIPSELKNQLNKIMYPK